MPSIKLLCSILALAAAAQSVQAATLTDADLGNCDVLLGKTRQAAFTKALRAMKQAAETGKPDKVMRYGSLLHNKMACIDERATGSSGYGMVISNEDGSQVEATHPPHASASAMPDLAATLKEAIRTFERVADTEISARVLLGQYYANYNDYLKQPGKGYVYVASVYDTECRPPAHPDDDGRGRCDSLRQDRILYNGMVSPAQRSALEDEAMAWAERYRARQAR